MNICAKMGKKSTKKNSKEVVHEVNLQNSLSALEEEEMELEVQLRRARIEQKRKELLSLSSNDTSADVQKNSTPVQKKTEETPQITTKSLNADKDLTAALELLNSMPLQDILSSTSSSELQTTSSGKCLHIVDYVSTPRFTAKESDRRIFKDIYQKGSKIKLDDVTIPQWLSANARILLQLMDSMTTDEVRDYLKYTAKVGDYLQKSDSTSVFLLDEEHRRMVASEGQKWNDVDGDKRFFYLESSESSTKAQASNFRKKPRGNLPMDNNGNPICLSFNSEKGCTRSWCSYSHVCSMQGCQASHPRHLHNAPPRFRGPTPKQE